MADLGLELKLVIVFQQKKKLEENLGLDLKFEIFLDKESSGHN